MNKRRCFIRHLAKMIGKMVASEPGVDYAALFYKPLEKVKEQQLRINKGNFDCYMLSKKPKVIFSGGLITSLTLTKLSCVPRHSMSFSQTH